MRQPDTSHRTHGRTVACAPGTATVATQASRVPRCGESTRMRSYTPDSSVSPTAPLPSPLSPLPSFYNRRHRRRSLAPNLPQSLRSSLLICSRPILARLPFPCERVDRNLDSDNSPQLRRDVVRRSVGNVPWFLSSGFMPLDQRRDVCEQPSRILDDPGHAARVDDRIVPRRHRLAVFPL